MRGQPVGSPIVDNGSLSSVTDEIRVPFPGLLAFAICSPRAVKGAAKSTKSPKRLANIIQTELISRLRATPGPERNIPVIALTADVYSRRPAEYVALGFNDFVSKPILVSGLMASIKRCTAGQPAALSRTG